MPLFQAIIVVPDRISMTNRLVNNLNLDRLLESSLLIRRERQTIMISDFIQKEQKKNLPLICQFLASLRLFCRYMNVKNT